VRAAHAEVRLFDHPKQLFRFARGRLRARLDRVKELGLAERNRSAARRDATFVLLHLEVHRAFVQRIHHVVGV
jgi:hypothetical protein